MISEIQTLSTRLDQMRMTPADRALARARLEQAEAFAAVVHAATAAVRRFIARALHASGRTGGLHPSA